MSKVKRISPFASEAFPSQGYPQVTISPSHSRTVTTSGQFGIDLSGQIASSFADQVKLSFRNLAAAVISDGARLEDVLKVTVYVVDYDPSKISSVTKAMAATFGSKMPANTLIGVARLFKPEVLFEIDAIAVLNEESNEYSPSEPIKSVDVVIVGAGMSGVQAAYECHKAGLSYVLLEAHDRIGGRARSEVASNLGSGVVDMGAAWINDTSQSEMYKLSKDLGLDLITQRAEGAETWEYKEGNAFTAPYGEIAVSETQAPEVEKVFGALYAVDPSDERVAADLDSLTFSQYIERTTDDATVRDLAKMISRALMGIEADVVSALWLVRFIKAGTGIENLISDLKDGAQYQRIRQGMSAFPQRLAQRLRPGSVRLSTPVTKVTQSSSGTCRVETFSGPTFTSKKVILSAPTPVYHKIQFEPPLPASKLLLSNSTLTGYYSKLIFVFSKPWWRESRLSGIMNTTVGPISFTRDTCSEEDEQYSLTGFIVGSIGHEWSHKTREERKRLGWEQLKKMYGLVVSSIPEPINILEKEWIKDPWVMGGSCPGMPPGVLTSDAGRSLAAPHQNIHFVGSETSAEWTGFIEGALRSGHRGANEVITALKKQQED
ncbi:hypothetical protein FOYG_04059 [Fusarium oxysporum NRRL 32931]|uniref:Amine oxidase n=1 Tax=Fusarium oxysporum NRRL 32931 TaxID=660029 RepID=W9INP3_FUSOX|nr:hypothetical protein FOYG_04059 [Fusarium oxysporum NRRL 32931]